VYRNLEHTARRFSTAVSFDWKNTIYIGSVIFTHRESATGNCSIEFCERREINFSKERNFPVSFEKFFSQRRDFLFSPLRNFAASSGKFCSAHISMKHLFANQYIYLIINNLHYEVQVNSKSKSLELCNV
jgi:hypothetical protein